MIEATKTAYVSPPHGELVLTLIHDANPRATLTLDLGIPNFTVFSMTLPLAEGEPKAMSELIAESVHVLLDEVASFMLSMEYEDKVIKLIYATVLTCFKGMSQEADTSKEQDESGQDPTVKMFEGTFNIPMDFINETQRKVVTASTSAINGVKKLLRMWKKFDDNDERYYLLFKAENSINKLEVQNVFENALEFQTAVENDLEFQTAVKDLHEYQYPLILAMVKEAGEQITEQDTLRGIGQDWFLDQRNSLRSIKHIIQDLNTHLDEKNFRAVFINEKRIVDILNHIISSMQDIVREQDKFERTASWDMTEKQYNRLFRMVDGLINDSNRLRLFWEPSTDDAKRKELHEYQFPKLQKIYDELLKYIPFEESFFEDIRDNQVSRRLQEIGKRLQSIQKSKHFTWILDAESVILNDLLWVAEQLRIKSLTRMLSSKQAAEKPITKKKLHTLSLMWNKYLDDKDRVKLQQDYKRSFHWALAAHNLVEYQYPKLKAMIDELGKFLSMQNELEFEPMKYPTGYANSFRKEYQEILKRFAVISNGSIGFQVEEQDEISRKIGYCYDWLESVARVQEHAASSTYAYTVGAEHKYDKDLYSGDSAPKMGQRDDYEGGWVWRTAEEAQEAIEKGLGGDVKYAVYKLELPHGWNEDVTPTPGPNGVHLLINDAPIIAKVQKTATSKIRRDPPTRHIEFTYSPKEKIKAIDTARVIRQYRNRSLKQQPRPMYVIVYNQMGRPTGTILVGPGKNFKNELLRKMKKSSVDFTESVSFVNEQEMKSSPLNGIPRTISVGGMTYQPESVSGGDMCLYHGPQDYIVKFVDGRSQIFPGRPTFRKMRQLNFPVPTKRYRWTTIPENSLEQSEPHIPEEPKEAAYEDSEKLKDTVQAESVDRVAKSLVYLKPMKTYDDLVPLDVLKKRLLRDKLADRPIFEGKMVIDRIGHRGVYEGQFKLIIPQYFIRRYGVQRDDGTFSVYHLRRDGKARRVGLRPVPAEEFREAKPIGEENANASGAV